jgi:hypothetical protein
VELARVEHLLLGHWLAHSLVSRIHMVCPISYTAHKQGVEPNMSAIPSLEELSSRTSHFFFRCLQLTQAAFLLGIDAGIVSVGILWR